MARIIRSIGSAGVLAAIVLCGLSIPTRTVEPVRAAYVTPRYHATAIVTSRGIVAMYRLGTDGWVWGASQRTPGGTFGPWIHIGQYGAGVVSNPQAVVTPGDQVVVLARGNDGHIHASFQNQNHVFGTWQPVGAGQPETTGDPDAVVTYWGTIGVFSRATDGWAWYSEQRVRGGSFTGWTHVGLAGAGVASDPRAVAHPPGESGIAYEVYARGTDGRMWGANVSSSGYQSTWALVGSDQQGFTDNPVVMPNVVNVPGGNGFQGTFIAVRGKDGWIWGASGCIGWTGSAACRWQHIGIDGSGAASAPEASMTGQGRLALYTRGEDGAIWGVRQQADWSWPAWQLVGYGQPDLDGVPTAMGSGVWTIGLDAWIWGSSTASGDLADFAPWRHVGA